jgi:hypothetical protein
MAIVVTTTWNCIDLISTFLHHYRKLGFDAVLAMDFESTDGTREVLTSSEWKHFVQIVPFPGIEGLDSSNQLLAVARHSCDADAWALFCDPDEFLVTPSMNIREPALESRTQGVESLSIPRFNVTALLSVARTNQSRLTALDALTLRIDRRHERNLEAQQQDEALEPPWIFTAIPSKVLVRVESALQIGDGDHSCETIAGRIGQVVSGVHLLHYPFRAYSQFASKIELATIDLSANQHLPVGYGWQLRRWIRLSNSGRLYEEYLQQFIADEHVQALLHDGTLALDETIFRFHREAKDAAPVTPSY